jgi:hypothetical protein
MKIAAFLIAPGDKKNNVKRGINYPFRIIDAERTRIDTGLYDGHTLIVTTMKQRVNQFAARG